MAKKRSTTPKATKASEAPKPMDPDHTPNSGASSARVRNAYALDTLIEEVTDLFPETTYEVGEPTQWNARTSVVFVTDGIEGLAGLLPLLASDERVKEITEDEKEGLVEIALLPSLRSMDGRHPFGLAEAWGVISEDNDEMFIRQDEGSWPDLDTGGSL